MDRFLLFYLIEGTPKPSYTFVSHHSNGQPLMVDDLRKTIFEDHCKRFVENHQSLTLLKIDVDSVQPGNYLPLLRFKKGDKGVEELYTSRPISEIWPEPPPAHRIHIFVTFTDLLEKAERNRGILEAAHLVYCKFWLEGGLDKLLQPVSGHKLKYLPKEHIDSLRLERLSYDEPVLLIREEYELAYEYLQLQEGLEQRVRSGGMVVTGQPGIGKSCFLYYLLFRLLSLKKNVAFQMDDQFLLFQDSGVQISSTAAINGTFLPDGIWALSDSHPGFDQPCNAFLKAGKSSSAWIVQTTSPLEDVWKDWSQVHVADMYWMDVVTLDEMDALGELLGLDTKIIRECYDSWGPSARNCIKFAKKPGRSRSYEDNMIKAAFELIKDSRDFNVPSATHRIFVARPLPDSREMASMDFGSNRLRKIVARAYSQQEHAARYSFYKTIRGHPWFGAPAGQMYKIHVLLWFCHARAGETLSCTGAQASFPKLELPSCPEDPTFFYKAEELEKVKEPEKPKCLIPTSRTFPTLDGIVLTSDAVITIQITISPKHDATEKEFDLVYDNLPLELLNKRPRRCHVFITDDGCNAKSLREQNRTEIPDGILSYTTVIGVDDLDSQAPATTERVDALEEARRGSTGRMRFDMDVDI